MTLWALALGLVLLALLALGASPACAREPLCAVETSLRLLNAATTLLLATLTHTSADVLRIAAVGFVGRLRRTTGALTERRAT